MAKAFLPSKDILKASDFLLPHLLAQNLGQSKVEGLCIDENLRRGPRAALQPARGCGPAVYKQLFSVARHWVITLHPQQLNVQITLRADLHIPNVQVRSLRL